MRHRGRFSFARGVRARLSSANLLAAIALIIALSGTSYAVVRISGKQFANHSIAGKKFKKNTITGKEIREATLGKVGRVRFSLQTGQIDTPSTATAATAGRYASSSASAADLIRLSVGESAVLLRSGHVTYAAHCVDDGGGQVRSDIDGVSDVGGTVALDNKEVGPGQPYRLYSDSDAKHNGKPFFFVVQGIPTILTSDGTAPILGDVLVGRHIVGSDCVFSTFGVGG
jgi:hypothetical protein